MLLSIEKVFCLSLLHYFACGKTIQKQSPNNGFTKSTPKLLDSTSALPDVQCAPEKSLHSRNDIKVMIDHIYNETSFTKSIKENYQSKAVAVRDKHIHDLKDFIAWFENQPEHLKHVLQRLTLLRKQIVEPNVEKVQGVLINYPKFETLYNEKNNKTTELLNKLNRYNKLCEFNCENEQTKAHNIVKRNVQTDFYCSSLHDLHSDITQKMHEFVKKLNKHTANEVILNDKKYAEKINEIKYKLKDKALKEFGQTMYDILNLEDQYHHFLDDITSKDLNVAVYNIKNLGLQIDTKLLHLEQVIDRFGQYCTSCSSRTLVRNVRQVLKSSEAKDNVEPTNLVNEMIIIKSNEIISEVKSDWKDIFNDLNTLIKKTDVDEYKLEKLKPLQEEVKLLTNDEKNILNKLKNDVPLLSIRKILDLIKKLEDLLKLIQNILEKLIPFS